MVTWASDPPKPNWTRSPNCRACKVFILRTRINIHGSLITHPLPLRTKDGALLKSYEAHTHTTQALTGLTVKSNVDKWKLVDELALVVFVHIMGITVAESVRVV